MLVNVTAPQVLAVVESEVWEHLRLALRESGSPEELQPSDRAHVLRLMQAAIDEIDGPDGLLQRCLVTQEWLLYIDCFAPVIPLPLPPTQSITSVRYIDSDGAWQTVDPADYQLAGASGTARAELTPAFGESWPSHAYVPRAVEIQFVAGYGDTPEAVPASIRAALCEIIATRYQFRESIIMGGASPLPLSARRTLDAHRVFG